MPVGSIRALRSVRKNTQGYEVSAPHRLTPASVRVSCAPMSDWKVSPHGPLEKLSDNLWRVEGALPGGPLKRVMTVVRRHDGGLAIHSAIALEEPMMRELEALGRPAYLLVPNGYHRLDAPRYKRRYPDIAVHCPRGARGRVAERVEVAGAYEDVPPDRGMQLGYVDGVRDGEGLLTVRSSDGVTLVINDLLFNMPHAPGPMGLVVRYVMASSGGPRVSRLARLALVKDKARFKSALLALADTPGLRRIVVSHHETISDDAAGVLRAVASAL